MNKKLGVVLAAAMAVTSMTGCGGSSSSTSTTAAEAAADKAAADGSEAKAPVGDPIELTFGHGQAEGHPYQQAALYFKDLVEKESGGSITVTVAPNGTLGDERESVEALQMGSTALCWWFRGGNFSLGYSRFPTTVTRFRNSTRL